MKRLAALALTLTLIATPLFALPTEFKACTKDKKVMVLAVELDPDANKDHPYAEHIQRAFAAAAEALSVEELQSNLGFIAFASVMDEDDWAPVKALGVPKVVEGASCEVK